MEYIGITKLFDTKHEDCRQVVLIGSIEEVEMLIAIFKTEYSNDKVCPLFKWHTINHYDHYYSGTYCRYVFIDIEFNLGITVKDIDKFFNNFCAIRLPAEMRISRKEEQP